MSPRPNTPQPSRNALPLAKNLDTWIMAAQVVIIFDTVFRGLAAVQLLGYAENIGPFYTAVKLIGYGGGMAGNIALLLRQKWGAWVGIAAAAIGFWLVAGDAWSLLHAAFGPGLIGNIDFLFGRAAIKTLGRGLWLAAYLAALLVLLRQLSERES
jgi:hypothetical protein